MIPNLLFSTVHRRDHDRETKSRNNVGAAVDDASLVPANTPPTDAAVSSPVAERSGHERADQMGVSFGAVLREMLQIVLPAILLALATHIFLAQATVVYGQSMQPSLLPAERLVVEKISYYFHAPERNDIVVIDLPQMSELLIKRVVGLPGETIEIRNGVLYIDGSPTAQSYEHIDSSTSFGPVTLRPMTYFVMGDNRINSNDSRAFGPVMRTDIVGRAWLRYWPLNRFTIFD